MDTNHEVSERPLTSGEKPDEAPSGAGGRVLAGRAIAELARTLAPEALEALADVMRNPRAPAAARVSAAQAIIERGHGKPKLAEEDRDAFVFAVQTLAVEAVRVPGVMASPIRAHLAAPAEDASELVDAAGRTVV